MPTTSKKFKPSEEKKNGWKTHLVTMSKSILVENNHASINEIDIFEADEDDFNINCPFCDRIFKIITKRRFKPSNFYTHLRLDHKDMCRNPALHSSTGIVPSPSTSTASPQSSSTEGRTGLRNNVRRNKK